MTISSVSRAITRSATESPWATRHAHRTAATANPAKQIQLTTSTAAPSSLRRPDRRRQVGHARLELLDDRPRAERGHDHPLHGVDVAADVVRRRHVEDVHVEDAAGF